MVKPLCAVLRLSFLDMMTVSMGDVMLRLFCI
jgi:hypothetical protein